MHSLQHVALLCGVHHNVLRGTNVVHGPSVRQGKDELEMHCWQLTYEPEVREISVITADE